MHLLFFRGRLRASLPALRCNVTHSHTQHTHIHTHTHAHTRTHARSLSLSLSLSHTHTHTHTHTQIIHQRALDFDIGVYFEANGHGTVLFSDHARAAISNKADRQIF